MRWTPEGAIAIVTGASSGIGMELCRLLVTQGSKVVACARRQDRLEELGRSLTAAEDSAGEFHPVAGDISEAATRQRLIEAAAGLSGGRLDLLVNNAGIGAFGPFEQASENRLRRIMEVNFFAPVELSRIALPLLHRGRAPVLCNIGSVLGHRAVPNKSEYCAAKFALHGWSDSLRAELHGSGIQVTLVSPSTTRSEFFNAVIDSPAGARGRSIGSWPADRVARAAMAAIRKRRAEVILSLPGKVLVYADRLAPALVNYALIDRSPVHREVADPPADVDDDHRDVPRLPR